MIKIVDLNHWRPDINLDLLAQYNIPGVYLKATEATNYTDDTYATYAQKCLPLDMVFGGYHYFRIQYDPIQQAEYFYSVASNTQLPPVLDVETTNNRGYVKQDFAQNVKLCLDKIEELFGRKPIIYTGYYTWADLTGSPAWANQYGLWIARYQVSLITRNQLPVGWTDWKFWQYTDRERFGPWIMDTNYFNGSLQELRQLAGKPTGKE
jgi:lysozyme